MTEGGGDEPPKKYPRASWEVPDTDAEPAEGVPAAVMPSSSTVSGSWETPAPPVPEPSVVVAAPLAEAVETSVATGVPATPPESEPSGYASETGGYAGGASGGHVVEPSVAVPGPQAIATRGSDELLGLPDTLTDPDDALRLAVGAKARGKRPPPPDFDDEDEAPRRRGKLWAILLLVGVVGLGIGALVLFGSINKDRYVIACEREQVIAKQGRGFPPWGERSIDDEGMWKPIKIPPEAECRPRETEDIEELSQWYLDILVDRASTILTAAAASKEVPKVDDAAALLDQALLHARAPSRREQRREIERLQGDVGYWRASAKLRDAAAALGDAAKQFDTAATQRPRHVSDASAWATYVRKLADELRAGPDGAATTFPPAPLPERPTAPPGVALPVEPAGSGSGEPPPAPPDAGLPTGGVLL